MPVGKLTRYALAALATELTQAASGVAGVFHGCLIQLATAGPATITDRNTVADWTKVDVAVDVDYLDYAPVWTSVGMQPDGNWRIQAPDYISSITTADLPDPIGIVGLYITDSGGTHLLYGQYFDAPVTLQNVGDSIEVEIAVPINLVSIDMEPE